MTDLDAIAAQARRRKAERDRTRREMQEAREAGLVRRRATRLARLVDHCPGCSVPLDGSTHWAWCTRDSEEDR